MKRPSKMCKIMVFVHGKSEFVLCKNIQSNLKIKLYIISNKKGENSIQITSILNKLNERDFKSIRNFTNKFKDIEYKKKELINFKLFIIMDCDDCTIQQKNDFLNKNLFKDHWLKDYIIPIYNNPNLEKTMEKSKIAVKKKKEYIDIFPINHNELNIEEVNTFLDKIKLCPKENSNLDLYIKECLEIANENLIQ